MLQTCENVKYVMLEAAADFGHFYGEPGGICIMLPVRFLLHPENEVLHHKLGP